MLVGCIYRHRSSGYNAHRSIENTGYPDVFDYFGCMFADTLFG